MDFNKKIEDFLTHSKDFATAMTGHVAEMKSKNKYFEILETLKFFPGDYVWIFERNQLIFDGSKLDHEGFHIGARAKFNSDGTDNRGELTPETQFKIENKVVESIAYGARPLTRSYWNGDSHKTAQWWYKVGWGDDWISDKAIYLSKQEALDKWSAPYIALRDNYFNSHWENVEYERKRKIEDAKRILSENGAL